MIAACLTSSNEQFGLPYAIFPSIVSEKKEHILHRHADIVTQVIKIHVADIHTIHKQLHRKSYHKTGRADS